MDKARRHELKMLKFKQRLKNYGINVALPGNINCFRTTGKPCSCYLCSSRSYKVNGEKKKEYKALKEEMVATFAN